MTLDDLLVRDGVGNNGVIVMRHSPTEPDLNRILPWLAAEKPDVFNAYQQTQSERVERAMLQANYVVSFIGHKPGKALFVGVYAIGKSKSLSNKQYWKVPAYIEMKKFGLKGIAPDRPSCLWFELPRQEILFGWKGKLIVDWPPQDRNWWRWADRNVFRVNAILEESALVAPMCEWQEINLTWQELAILPTSWREALSHWRGIYLIYDVAISKGYVGSAYGSENLLGRWRNYSRSGHGGNRLLRDRDPANFRFSILERVSPDMAAAEVIQLEASWKWRLHTRQPSGLNDN